MLLHHSQARNLYSSSAKTMNINSTQIRHRNWKTRHIIKDVRPESPTRGKQFEIMDCVNGVVTLEQLPKELEVRETFIFSQIDR